MPTRRVATLGALLLATASVALAQPPDARLDFFEKRIRPVLVERCFECHGGGEASGGLRLDSAALWQRGGDSGPAIAPGKPDESRLLKALKYGDSDLQMPPDGKLPEAVVADFERWIADGAVDPREDLPAAADPPAAFDLETARRHWAYRLPVRPAVPEVGDTQGPADVIDAFVLNKLEAAGLRPAADVDRTTLIRRLSFDLVGLPPTPEAIQTFLADTSPQAYERLVDQMLASPQYGERWGRHWLDVVRFAESFTLRGLVMHEAWRYRDYVIETINADRPFDRFLREQLAGDLLPAETLDEKQRQRIATSFLAMGNNNLEEQDKTQLRMDVVDEQLETIGRAMLAQTIGCARCHDHKFDPIPTADYYAMAGILRNVQTLADANVSQWLDVPLPLPPEAEQRVAEFEAAESQLADDINKQKALVAKLEKADPAGPRVVAAADLPGVIVDDRQAKVVGAWQKSQSVQRYVGDGYLHDANEGQGAKTLTFIPELPEAGRYEVRLAYTQSDNRATNATITVFSADGEFVKQLNQRERPAIDGRFESLGQYRFERNGQGFVIVSNAGADGHVVADAVQFLPVALADVAAQTEGADQSPEFASADKRLRKLEGELKKLRAAAPARPRALSIVEMTAIEDSPIHVRGSVHNLREVVPRGFLRVADFGPPVEMPAAQSGRLELADWIASDRNSLAARTIVNRAWHWLFGAGIVRTTDNFGTTGELPSHPELLDELTVQFMADGWSLKRLVRRIVLSRTYRQSAQGSPDLLAADPENRLFGRASRRRLDAESLRDAMLQAADRLSLEQGGPTTPADLAADYGYVDTGVRRSVYVPVLRNALPEIFLVFDFADPSIVTGVRNTSTVAPQALFLMNDPFVREQARFAAQRLIAEMPDHEARLATAFRRLLGRDARADESAAMQAFLASGQETEAAWAQVVHALFGSIDFRYVQ